MDAGNTGPGYIWCCDWGTSSFRLKLVNKTNADIIYECAGEGGIAAAYDRWQAATAIQPTGRKIFFLEIIRNHIVQAGKVLSRPLSDLPVIISGMASSSIGMAELSYATVPFHLHNSTGHISVIEEADSQWGAVILVSGIATKTDVMRGEETQLAGLYALRSELFENHVISCILPGTHSKHVTLSGGSIVDFKTHLTGELFHLLTRYSILKSNITAPGKDHQFTNNDRISFRKGVQYATENNFLHSVFSTRTNALLHDLPPEENFYYLSGLLIGYELSGIRQTPEVPLLLCCGNNIYPFYIEAIEILGLKKKTTIISPAVIESCYVMGQLKWAEKLF